LSLLASLLPCFDLLFAGFDLIGYCTVHAMRASSNHMSKVWSQKLDYSVIALPYFLNPFISFKIKFMKTIVKEQPN
jgi:hypothetical protein